MQLIDIGFKVLNEKRYLPDFNSIKPREKTGDLVPLGCPIHENCFECSQDDCIYDAHNFRNIKAK